MKNAILYSFLLVSSLIFAQGKDKDLPKGNTEFAEKKYVDAEADYRISGSKAPNKAASSYNLGNSIYRQNLTAEAKNAYMKSIKDSKTHPEKHSAFHNLGNVYMKEKKYTEAVEAYKNALRNDPEDEQSRYNYALAKQKLKENPPPKDKDKKDKKDDKKKDDKKDKKDDKKDGKDKKDDKGKDNKDKDGNKPKDDGKPKDEGKPKPKEGGISKQRLENMLDAVNNEEKKVQEKVNARKVKAHPVKSEKDW
ncbi:MAG TPA: tetratricopeptide repeat protein [Flavobacterium sp.]|nr:tetratricopeptide repeat protein [Flavobacterium sp.]